MVKLFKIIILMAVLLPSFSYAKVSATVDRATIEEGETLLLTVRSDDESPELEILNQFFDVLGTSTSSKVSFVNGKVNSEKEWQVTLSPRRMGISIIPSIKIGNEATPPIRIEVKKQLIVKNGQGADVFLEAKLDTKYAYVQSQVIYVVRLFRAVDIRDGSLTEPKINDAVVERMGEDVTFQTTRNQRRYQVTERRFAIFPQKSGNLVIDPTIFRGQVLTPVKNNRQSNDPFDRFFQSQQRAKRVQIKSETLTLEVSSEPKDYNGDIWLPAKRVMLEESWTTEPPVFKVGEPITRSLRLEALGQTGAQLPEFKTFTANGIKQYSDQPLVETRLMDGSLLGIREEKFAIVPTESGKLILPEIRISWWDTEMDQEQIVTIAPKIITVAAADNVKTNEVVQSRRETEIKQPTLDVTEITEKVISNAGIWPFVSIGLFFIWCLTIVAWVFHARKFRVVTIDDNRHSTKTTNISSSIRSAEVKIKKACQNNNPIDVHNAIFEWADIIWPESKTRSLSVVASRIEDSALTVLFSDLTKTLYAEDNYDWNGTQFYSDIAPRLKKSVKRLNNTKNRNEKIKALPGLYPARN